MTRARWGDLEQIDEVSQASAFTPSGVAWDKCEPAGGAHGPHAGRGAVAQAGGPGAGETVMGCAALPWRPAARESRAMTSSSDV